ncbi:glutathione reductase [Ameyamaea chiangmaiensis NBRC 103196]|uniref:NAD(P)/FAD-dependent oxidoreductase n=1 Tax=Ameyamaea chiangmaiensis TaxID=442969 RepID=UPI0021567182|nr:NAD(P)/FAD-dependent oxidoreductase [Ameyamaea chiangmaiensis]GBQ63934.1 glutathione reductase [Ameyamaea chiangmaiensis NBRC 103196]
MKAATPPHSVDVAVIGAGAAGLMAAGRMGQAGLRVVVFDHNDEPGRKILISGGGRCNFTHLDAAPRHYLSANPHFVKSALARYTPADFVRMVDRHHIAWHHKSPGQLFCDGSARQIVNMLMAECPAGQVTFQFGTRLTAVDHCEDRFCLATTAGAFEARSVVLATGGLSIPKLGASSFSYDVAKRFGHSLVPTRAGLVPFVLSGGPEADALRDLAGVSVPSRIKVAKETFSDALLFTHRGLSGPALLQASSYWTHGGILGIDLLPGGDALSFLTDGRRRRPRAALATVLSELLPQRLARFLTHEVEETETMANQPDRRLRGLAERIHRWQIVPAGTEGYAKAEVTCGGIDTRDLSSQNMGSRRVPGLFVIGEAVDVTGWLGGYNFQWAWSSAVAAAGGAVEHCRG